MTVDGVMTVDEARSWFSEVDGALWWRKANSNRAPAGSVAGSTAKHGYRVVVVNGRSYKGHRVVWLLRTGKWPTLRLDHINGVRGDNRFENLREATARLNAANRIGRRARKYALPDGVHPNPGSARNPYRAAIKVNGKQLHIGTFPTPEAASAAHLKRRMSAIDDAVEAMETFSP